MAANGSSVAEVGDFQHKSPLKALTLNNGKMFIKCTSAPFWQHYVSSSLRFINDKTQFKMDVFPKFIIETDGQEGDCLIVAKCTYHKQLATDIKKVKGGGWWTLDKENSIFTLHGEVS